MPRGQTEGENKAPFILNPLHMKCVSFMWTEYVPRSKHSSLRLYRTTLLMSYNAKVAVCSEIRMKHIQVMKAPCSSSEY